LAVRWERDPGFDNSLGLMNASWRNGELNVLSPSVYLMDIHSSSEDARNYFSTGPYHKIGRIKFPVPAGFYVFTDVDKVVIRSASTVEVESTESIIDLKSLDPNFFEFEDIPYWVGESVGLNNSNFILVPYRTTKMITSFQHPFSFLHRLKPKTISSLLKRSN
jgi:hypothetical protein